MKKFKDLSEVIHEGVLGNIDDTIKQSDKTVKRMKDVEDVKKLRYLLNDLFNNLSLSNTKNTDANGVKIEFGDVVICKDMDMYGPEPIFGIVVEDNYDKNGTYRIIAGTSRWSDEDYVWGDSITYDFKPREIIVLAKKRNAKKMLELLVKLL